MNQTESNAPAELKRSPASLHRRLFAICYDSILLFAVLMMAGFFMHFMVYYLFESHLDSLKDNLFYHLVLYAIGYFYFAFAWIRSGQTLGMRSWHLKVLQANGDKVTWQQASLRAVLAIVSWLLVGLGFVISLFDAQKRSLHDRGSNTYLYHVQD